MLRFLVLIVITVIVITNGEKKCDIDDAAADICGAKLLVIGNRDFTIPKNDKELIERCDQITDGIKCYKNYTKNCLDNLSAQVMGMVTKNGHKIADKICKTESGRKELMENLQCFKTEDGMSKVHLCMDKYIVQMERVSEMDGDFRIPGTCCAFHMLRECAKNKGMESCEQKSTIEYIDNIVAGVSGDIINFSCGKYKSLEECDSRMDSNTWKTLKELVASDDVNEITALKKYSSPFAALREILKKFKS